MKKNTKSSLTHSRKICKKKQKLGNVQHNIVSVYNDESIVHPTYELNQDCLVHIFEFLPIVDRFRVEQVCKQWYEASQLAWKNVKVLSFSANSWGFKSIEVQLNVPIIKKMLNLCGNKIIQINKLEDSAMIDDRYSLAFLPRFCPNLQYASFSNVTERLIKELSIHCQNITTLNLFMDIDRCNQDILGDLFSSLQNLKSIKLYTYDNIVLYSIDSCIQYLNAESIEEIYIIRCLINWRVVCESLRKFRKLHTLELSDIRNSNQISYLLNCLNILNIKKLVLDDYSEIDDEFLLGLKNVYENLKCLNISSNYNITNRGLTAIALLANLEELNINYLPNISSIQMLSGMSNLKKLSCVGIRISDDDVIKFLCGVERIEFLDLTNCCIQDPKNFPRNVVKTMECHNNNVTVMLKSTLVEACDLPPVSAPVTFIL